MNVQLLAHLKRRSFVHLSASTLDLTRIAGDDESNSPVQQQQKRQKRTNDVQEEDDDDILEVTGEKDFHDSLVKVYAFNVFNFKIQKSFIKYRRLKQEHYWKKMMIYYLFQVYISKFRSVLLIYCYYDSFFFFFFGRILFFFVFCFLTKN